MIPIRDTIPSRNYPVANTALIGINVVIFLVQLVQGNNLDRFIYTYGLVPARYSFPELTTYFTLTQQVLALVSFMFLHGGFWHLLGNMWSLYIFGDNIEDRLGSLRYLLFYLLCGLFSGLSHLVLNLNSNVPTIGASGAIAGVMGAYFMLYPKAKILTLVPIIIIPLFFEIPAFFFLGLWLLMQFINLTGSHGQMGGIAWWAHIGGFMFGIIFLKLFLMLPGMGISAKIHRVTEKKKTPRLQVLRLNGTDHNPHLYGTITITPHEARLGSQKLVNMPWGFQKRLFRIKIPPGTGEGQKLRLAGQGKTSTDDTKGDLFLKVVIKA